MHSNCRLLPEDIVCKLTQRNNIRIANNCDPVLKLLNEEISSDIHSSFFVCIVTRGAVGDRVWEV